MKIAFVGLGVMGAPMAGHLVAAGHEVVGFNRSAGKTTAWAEKYGGQGVESVARPSGGRAGDHRPMRRSRFRRSRGCRLDAGSPGARNDPHRPHHNLGEPRQGDGRPGRAARLSFPRRARLRWPGGRREGSTVGHGRRRRGRRCGGRAGDPILRQVGPPNGRSRRRPTDQDGQSDLHRRGGPGPGRGGRLRRPRRSRSQPGLRGGFPGGGSVVADGQPLGDHGPRRVRLRLRRRLDAQGSRPGARRSPRQWRRLEVTALVDQFYAEVQAMGGRRWDTSSLAARLQKA